MAKCQNCGKKTRTGRNVSHSERKTSRKFRVNIQKVTVTVGGLKMKMRLCAKCIKKLKASTKGKKGKKKEETGKKKK